MATRPRRRKFLTVDEVKLVLDRQAKLKKRSISAWRRDVIFRLSTICGLRVSEITNLKLRNVRVMSVEPYLEIENSKGGKSRDVTIPDLATIHCLREWLAFRQEQQAEDQNPDAPFINQVFPGNEEKPINRHSARRIFLVACSILGPERLKDLTIHSGRHTACSMLWRLGIAAPSIRDFMGHTNLATTAIYSHALDPLKPVNIYEKPADPPVMESDADAHAANSQTNLTRRKSRLARTAPGASALNRTARNSGRRRPRPDEAGGGGTGRPGAGSTDSGTAAGTRTARSGPPVISETGRTRVRRDFLQRYAEFAAPGAGLEEVPQEETGDTPTQGEVRLD